MPEKNGIRNYKRIPVKLEAGITADSSEYTGFIENVSEHGLSFITFSDAGIIAFLPGAKLGLKFKPFDDKIELDCEIKWVEINKNSPSDLVYTIAVEIQDPPKDYKKFFKTLK